MFNLVIAVLLATLVSGCARSPAHAALPTNVDKNFFVGSWAMIPLKNGIANVVEFREDDQVLLHSFNCETPLVERGVETSHYAINEDHQTIHLTSPGHDTQIKILGTVGRVIMKLEQPINLENESQAFNYLKVTKIRPLCELYKPQDKSKKTTFKSGDFIAAPIIPAHPDIEKYTGKWQYKNVTELEIVKDKKGQFMLSWIVDDNWHYLYNGVHWVGDELYFQIYAYSEKPELFDHPVHKSQAPCHISLLPNGKMRMTIELEGKKLSAELMRE